MNDECFSFCLSELGFSSFIVSLLPISVSICGVRVCSLIISILR